MMLGNSSMGMSNNGMPTQGMNMNNHNMDGMKGMGGMGNMDGMKMNGTGDMMMMMQMYFMLGDKVTILFKEWKTNNVGELIASCFALFVLAVVYEGLKVGRQILLSRAETATADVFMNSNEGSGLARENVITIIPPRKKLRSLAHVVQSLLHMIQVFIGYLLMLAFMTYNCWICIAVIIGSGMGYFLFGWKTATIVSSGDHCN